MKTDLYSTITDQIIAGLSKGFQPWFQPWRESGTIRRPLRADGIPYQGINVLMLWASAMENGYQSPTWMTFKKAVELGGCVRKGEKGTQVVYAATYQKDKGSDDERAIPFLKAYAAFNVEQIDGLPERFYQPDFAPLDPALRLAHADQFFANIGVKVHDSDKASYNPKLDMVNMPGFGQFRDREAYYSVLSHEVVHWTGHKTRIDRDLSGRFGDSAYAMEEMIAEIGAAFLCCDLGLIPEPSPSQVAYIGSWIKVLKRDKKAVFTAASMAGKAVEYLHSKQPQEMAEAA